MEWQKSGIRVPSNLSSDRLKRFEYNWSRGFHLTWQPAFPEDLLTNQIHDFFKTIVSKVKFRNESHDIIITGDRGTGKSAYGLSAAQIMHAYFENDLNAEFPLSRVCFDVDSWLEVTGSIAGGGVVILDEVGVEGSLSSRTSMSKGNRTTSDVIQLCRTDRIITIFISTDRDRIDKRVRQLASIMITPIRKLNDKQTNGHGLAIEADVRIHKTRPATKNDHKMSGENDSSYLIHEIKPLQYSPKGIITSVIVPHPPIELWLGYEEKRAKKLQEVRDRGFMVQEEREEDVDKILKKKSK
jgi:hypothetical protein